MDCPLQSAKRVVDHRLWLAKTNSIAHGTTEYSVRTAMERVYRLLNVERGVPEVFNSTYDIRKQLAAMGRLGDGKDTKAPGRRAF